MPLVIIKSLAPADSGALAPMLEDVRDSGARAIGDAPSNIWVMFEPLPPACYLQETRVPVVLIKAKSGRTRSSARPLWRRSPLQSGKACRSQLAAFGSTTTRSGRKTSDTGTKTWQ